MKKLILNLISFLLILTNHLNSFGQFNHPRVYSTFDNLSLIQSDTFNNGADINGKFFHFGRNWINEYNSEWDSWTGWALSNMTDTITPGYGNQFSAIPGHGVSHTANYMVGYGNTYIKLDRPSLISGAYFTNSTYTYYDLLEGSSFSKKFGGESGNDPDFLSVHIYSYLAGNIMDSTEFFLADFRFDDQSSDYIIDDWVYVDFNNDQSQDSKIDSIAFVFESSDTNSFGIRTPTYLCMDDFNAISTAQIIPEKIIMNPDTFYNGQDQAGGFSVSHLFFPNTYNATFESWSGWSVSSIYDNVSPGYTNQYAVFQEPLVSIPESTWNFEQVHFVNSGITNSIRSPYFDDEEESIFGLVQLPVPVRFYITNATYAALDMRYGSGFSKKFGGESGDDPDYFRLLIKSISSSNHILHTDTIYLADYRFEENSKDYILKDWQMADIVSCDRVDFELQSSDIGTWGINTPAYFCLSLAQQELMSVEDYSISSIQLYPNPTQQTLNIQAHSNIQRIELFSLSGLIIQEMNCTTVSSFYKMDVSNLNRGLYYARVYTNDGISVSKFMKQ